MKAEPVALGLCGGTTSGQECMAEQNRHLVPGVGKKSEGIRLPFTPQGTLVRLYQEFIPLKNAKMRTKPLMHGPSWEHL